MTEILRAPSIENSRQIHEAQVRGKVLLLGHLVSERYLAELHSEKDAKSVRIRVACRPQRLVNLTGIDDNRIAFELDPDPLPHGPKLDDSLRLCTLLPEHNANPLGVPKVFGVVKPGLQPYGVLLGREAVEAIGAQFDMHDIYSASD
jgi:hypothetical protein